MSLFFILFDQPSDSTAVLSEHEQRMIDALQKGDPSAMNVVFQTYHARLCLVSFRITGDTDVAKDIVQDVLLKFWQNRKSLNIEVSLEFYLKRAVVNTTLNFLERSKKKTPLDDTLSESVLEPVNFIEQEHDASDLSKKIDEAIAALPPRTKAVFTLIRLEEMTYREAAECLSVSTKAVEKEMMKALSILRNVLRDYLPLFFIFFL